MDNSKNIPSVTIRSIKFKNRNDDFEFNDDDLVLFVGANNVGKSRTLKDIKEELQDSKKEKVIIENIDFKVENFTKINMKDYFKSRYKNDSYGNYNVRYDNNGFYCYNENDFENIDSNQFVFLKVLFTFLSTENRLNITNPILLNGEVDNYSLNIMNKLYIDIDSINAINDYLLKAFNMGIDVYHDIVESLSVMKYKIGCYEEINSVMKLNRREGTIKLSEMEDLHEQGDGIRSAVAILSSFIANSHSLYLIDEPETFLHPPQAKLLGKNIVELSRDKQCFISTHNIDLIRGILESNSKRVKVIKIERNENFNTFYELNNEDIMKIANDRNLKYTNILNGLFYDQVILCENESDCRFYSAILESIDVNQYQNTLFCAVGGKDQFKQIIPILKNLCIKYFVIADIDLINNRDKLKQLLNSIENKSYNLISEAHNTFLTKFEEETNSQVREQREIKQKIDQIFNQVQNEKYMSTETANKIKQLLKEINSLSLLKKAGTAILPAGICSDTFNEINQYLRNNRIYIVECGEIERFIPTVKGHGNNWVNEVFDKYKDMNDKIYLRAKTFLKDIFKNGN